MGPLGWQETVFIFVLALLIFGPKKLPELGKTIGKALTEFRRASSELKHTWDREMSNLERESESIREVTSSVQSEINDYSSSYTYEDSMYGTSDYDSAAESSSTVSASAPEGADPTADGTPEYGVAGADAATEDLGTAHDSAVADAGGAEHEPKPAGMAGADPASEPKAVAG
ncbi:MAG: twin-arginine translocase TatA/TatE family subunit [Bryobacterales bacterium]|nr:twin-arginine translocase TatA/TatE family subunit [Bryobacterales bacterium]